MKEGVVSTSPVAAPHRRAAASDEQLGPPIESVLVDYAGVLTNPLKELYSAFSQACGLSMDEIALVMTSAAIEFGRQPLEALEVGEITEREFLDMIGDAILREGTKQIDLSDFRRQWFTGVVPNVEFVEYLRRLRGGGYRLGLITNNVREWREVWAPTVPLSDFELVVDSCEQGCRKPEPAIYERTLALLGLEPSACLFVDDVWEHCATARDLGMHTVWFQSTRQATFDIDRVLARHRSPRGKG
ncbi:MAG: HAD family phosphatase [Actinomycetota bacterium]|nr:HAD family phosphatase [Actinomycetota bacterium]